MLLATGAWLNLHTPSQWILLVMVPVQSSVKYSQIYSQLRSEAVKTTRLIMVKKRLSKKWQAASGLKCFTSEISALFAFCTISEKCVNKNFLICVFFKDFEMSKLVIWLLFLVGFDYFPLQRKKERGTKWMTYYRCCKKIQWWMNLYSLTACLRFLQASGWILLF